MNTNTQKYYKVKDKLRTAYIIAVETNAVTSGMINMSDAVTSHSLHARTHARTHTHTLSLINDNELVGRLIEEAGAKMELFLFYNEFGEQAE